MAGELDDRLLEHSRVWQQKPALRAIYQDFHDRIEAACPPGRLLEIGGGSGHFRSERPDVVSLDILAFPGIDVVSDAHRLPFSEACFAGIVMLDVLHHLQHPIAFLREAARVLQPGGRIAMIEPGMSVVSRRLYGWFHQEPVIMTADPFSEHHPQSGDDPFDSNQAIPTLLFANATARAQVERAVPELRVVGTAWLSLFAYPLSGGFKAWSLLPDAVVRPLLRLEDKLLGPLGPALAFRLLVTLERRGAT